MSIDPVSQARSKDIALDYHFIHEQVAAGNLTVKFITLNM